MIAKIMLLAILVCLVCFASPSTSGSRHPQAKEDPQSFKQFIWAPIYACREH